jgi:L-2-hydroxyglutarate oxidase LhgO
LLSYSTIAQRVNYCNQNCRFPQLDRELHFGYERNGSLVVAFSEEDEAHLLELKRRGEQNGVQRLRIVGKEELFQMEPYLNPKARAALFAPDAGNLIPYEYAIALAENAVDNGVELRIRREVVGIEKEQGAGGLFSVRVNHWEPRKYLEAMRGKSKVDQVSDAKGSRGVFRYFVACSLVLCAVAIRLAGDFVPSTSEISQQIWIKLPYVSAVCAVLVLMPDLLSRVGASAVAADEVGESGSSTKGSRGACAPPVGEGGEKVSIDSMRVGGSGSREAQAGEVVETEVVRARFVVNCAGSYSDKIANMIGDDSFKIKPRLGDYILLSRDQGKYARHTLFPCPGPLGKGVLVQTTLWGMLILGPTARDYHLPEVMKETAEDIQRYILEKCRQLVPFFDAKETITSFCGVRAKSTRGDWIIEPSRVDSRFIHAAGIDSPGTFAFECI